LQINLLDDEVQLNKLEKLTKPNRPPSTRREKMTYTTQLLEIPAPARRFRGFALGLTRLGFAQKVEAVWRSLVTFERDSY
jgi:hypothetical protein